ncbi:hypothetical protein L9F63_025903, partial [Diploptera punctata]
CSGGNVCYYIGQRINYVSLRLYRGYKFRNSRLQPVFTVKQNYGCSFMLKIPTSDCFKVYIMVVDTT